MHVIDRSTAESERAEAVVCFVSVQYRLQGCCVRSRLPGNLPPGKRQGIHPSDIAKASLKSWDKAVFASELISLNIVPPLDPAIVGQKKADGSNVGDGQVQEGTYSGTQLALTEIYDRIERG